MPDFDSLDIGNLVACEDGEWVIVWRTTQWYFIYEWHLNWIPQHREVITNNIIGVKVDDTELKVTELKVRYAEISIKILTLDSVHNRPSDEKNDLLESVLERVETMIAWWESFILDDIEQLVEDYLEWSSYENPEINSEPVVWDSIIRDSSVAIETPARRTEIAIVKNRKSVLAVTEAKVPLMRSSSTDVAKTLPVPTELALIKSPSFPISLWTLSVSELIPVAKIIEAFVENPYDIKVLREFRQRIYETLYRSSSLLDEFDDLYADNFWRDETISFDEVGLNIPVYDPGKRYIVTNSYAIRNQHDSEKSYQSLIDMQQRDHTARVILRDFDALLTTVMSDPAILEDADFKERLDEEIGILSDIVWADSEERINPLKVNSLSRRKNTMAKEPIPQHTLPALWHAIQTQVLTVRLHEQVQFIESEFESRIPKSQIITHTPEGATDRVAMRYHFNNMYRYYCEVKGISYGKKNTNSIPRTLTREELRSFRNSTAQFDIYYQKLSTTTNSSDIVALIWLDI